MFVGDDLTTDGSKVQISLVQQIFDEMFSTIIGQDEFSPDIVEDLKQLAAKGDLKKPQKVAKIIRSTLEDGHETT
jgi:hypothetical protein